MAELTFAFELILKKKRENSFYPHIQASECAVAGQVLK